MRAAFAILVTLWSAPALSSQCVPVDSILEKATENKREYAHLEKGEMLSSLNEIYIARSGVNISADRATVIDMGNGLIIAFQVSDSFCGFLAVTDDDIVATIRNAVFGTKI